MTLLAAALLVACAGAEAAPAPREIALEVDAWDDPLREGVGDAHAH